MLSFHVMLYRIAMLLNIPTKHNYSYLLNCVMYKLVPNDTFKHLNTTHCIDIYFWFAIFKMREIGAGGSLQFVQADGARIVLKLEAFGAGVVWSLMTMGTIWAHYIPVVQKNYEFNSIFFGFIDDILIKWAILALCLQKIGMIFGTECPECGCSWILHSLHSLYFVRACTNLELSTNLDWQKWRFLRNILPHTTWCYTTTTIPSCYNITKILKIMVSLMSRIS